MRVLAIDTSSAVLGVAVLDEDGQGAEFNFNLGLRHASHLVPTIKRAISFSGLTLKDIDAYCVSIGPGSFTGLRIGVCAIKALWLADKKKVVAVPTLDVLARNVSYTNGTICVAVDAKKEKLYTCFYKYKSSLSPHPTPSPQRGEGRGEGALLMSYNEFLKRLSAIRNDILLVGDGAEKIASHKYKVTTKDFWYPRAINAARIGLEMARQGKVVKDVDALVPLYLHPKDVQCRK
jgi:tRNA threonylcarbamoyl adenosine modification protein YeaZ